LQPNSPASSSTTPIKTWNNNGVTVQQTAPNAISINGTAN